MARYILALDQLVSVSPSHTLDVSIPFDGVWVYSSIRLATINVSAITQCDAVATS